MYEKRRTESNRKACDGMKVYYISQKASRKGKNDFYTVTKQNSLKKALFPFGNVMQQRVKAVDSAGVNTLAVA